MSALPAATVGNIRQALALSRSLALVLAEDPHAEVGAALDELVGFFRTWHYSALLGKSGDVNTVFDNLGAERAGAAAAWLGRRAADWDTFLYWQRVVEHCHESVITT